MTKKRVKSTRPVKTVVMRSMWVETTKPMTFLRDLLRLCDKYGCGEGFKFDSRIES